MSRPLAAFALMAVASAIGIWTLPRSAGTSRPVAPAPTALVAPPVVAAPTTLPVVASRSTPDRHDARCPAPARPTPQHPLAAASRVARDPVTGQVVAPEYAAPVTVDEMQAAARREAEGLVTLRNPDGSETLNHEGRFADHMVVRVGPDGRPYFMCVHGQAGVAQALRPAPSAGAGLEDR